MDVEGYPILSFNVGSSSLKFALYLIGDEGESLLAAGTVERISLEGGRLWIRGRERDVLEEKREDFPTHRTSVQSVLSALERLSLPNPAAAGHRVVHGGSYYVSPAKVDAGVLDTLRKLIPFAPLHLPVEIEAIGAVADHFPDLPQVACFDTAFHSRMPEVARRLPLPGEFWDEGVRRYGFHGLSYEYILDTLDGAAKGRLIVAHLGNGASMAAVRDGQPMDTTMGFTPTGGFMMSTRSGDLDPGVLLYLMNKKGYDARQVERLVNHEAGLLGVSGISPDMETLLKQKERSPHARQAVEMFCYQARKYIGALTAVLGGIDLLVFTGGIGERAAPVRWEICQGLEHLGILLDPEQNSTHADTISAPGSRCAVRVIRTNEDLMIARQTYRLLFFE